MTDYRHSRKWIAFGRVFAPGTERRASLASPNSDHKVRRNIVVTTTLVVPSIVGAVHHDGV